MTETQHDLVDSLRATPIVAEALVRGFGKSTAAEPSHDGWSVAEILAHLAAVDELMVGRFARIVAEDEPVIADYDPEKAAAEGGFSTMNVESALTWFLRSRAAHVAFLDGLSEGAWERIGRHETDGSFTITGFTLRNVNHDLAHLAQLASVINARG